jgi:hypothetical protein
MIYACFGIRMRTVLDSLSSLKRCCSNGALSSRDMVVVVVVDIAGYNQSWIERREEDRVQLLRDIHQHYLALVINK